MIALPDIHREPEPLRPMRVLGSRLLCRLLDPAQRSAGGIWLPDTMRENYTHARVLVAGPGIGRGRQEEFESGSQIVFPKDKLSFISKTDVHVRMEDVIASVMEDADGNLVLLPENDWVMVARDEARERTTGGLIIPWASQRRDRSGNIADVGPGRLRLKGPLEGTREHPLDTMGLPPSCNLSQIRVYWNAKVECPQVSLTGRAWWFVRACDLLVAEWVEDER